MQLHKEYYFTCSLLGRITSSVSSWSRIWTWSQKLDYSTLSKFNIAEVWFFSKDLTCTHCNIKIFYTVLSVLFLRSPYYGQYVLCDLIEKSVYKSFNSFSGYYWDVFAFCKVFKCFKTFTLSIGRSMVQKHHRLPEPFQDWLGFFKTYAAIYIFRHFQQEQKRKSRLILFDEAT